MKLDIEIPMISLSENQGRINKGLHAGETRYYRDALYATLLHLRPKIICEIGTHTANSSLVINSYLENYMPDGHLYTLDIKKYVDLSEYSHITQVQVYPHLNNMSDWHPVRDDDLLPEYRQHSQNSVMENIRLLFEAMPELHKSGKVMDLVLIDADHQRISAERDMMIADYILKDNGYYLFDDIYEEEHECAKYYEEILKESYDTYEYENWDVCVGMSLMKRKTK